MITPLFLINAASRHQIYLEGYKTHLFTQFAPFLIMISKSIEKRLLNVNLTEFTRTRLETLLKKVKQDINDQYQAYYDIWKEQVIDFAEYESGFEIRTLKKVAEFDFVTPSRTQLKSAIFSSPLSEIIGPDKGKLLESFYNDWTNETVKRTEGIIRAGYFQGKTTPQIVKEIKGTENLKFKDGQLARGNKDIATVTRTAVQHASNQARNETWKANSDIVKKVLIVATLDSRTSAICWSMDGREYPIDEGPRPPFHPNCRTTTVAVLDDRFKILDEGSTRAARTPGGKVVQVSASMTYFEWLKKQPPGFQDSVIGKKRGKLLRDGGLSAKEFSDLNLNDNFAPRTLKEMRDLEPLAFELAGL